MLRCLPDLLCLITLADDIEVRCQLLARQSFSEYGNMKAEEINKILAHCEFEDTCAFERHHLARRLYDLNYRAMDGSENAISKEAYWNLSREVDESLNQLRLTFVPTVKWELLNKLSQSPKRLAKASDIAEGLRMYYQVDRQLSKLEKYTVAAINEIESHIQSMIDIARGK